MAILQWSAVRVEFGVKGGCVSSDRQRPDRQKERVAKIKRDLIGGGIAVVLLAGLGAFIAFLTGDFGRLFDSVRFALINEPAPVTGLPRPTPAAHSTPKGCKYCALTRELYAGFAAKALAAQNRRDAALQAVKTGPQDGVGGRVVAERQRDLAEAEDALARHTAAANVLKDYVAACDVEAFCKPDYLAKGPASCPETTDDAAMRGPAAGLATAARDAAVACIASECPKVDCAQAAQLRKDLVSTAATLTVLGAPMATVKGQPAIKDLPVGPATLAAEVSKAIKEIEFLVRLYPSLLERQSPNGAELATQPSAQFRSMAPELSAKQAEELRQAAELMTEAAMVTPFPVDARREAAWRLKALSLSVQGAGELSVPATLNGPDGAAFRMALTQAWGGVMVDLAAVTALFDRLNAQATSTSGCNGQTLAVAQATLDAAALVDLCRARAACPVSVGVTEAAATTATDALGAARERLPVLVSRAQTTADVLASVLGAAVDNAQGQLSPEAAQARQVMAAEGVCRAPAQP